MTTYTFSELFTFTRSTTATFVGSNGLIQTAAINAPRFDYDPATLQPKGILIEEQRTNNVRYSENFTQADWLKLADGAGVTAVVTPNYATAPDGSNNGTRLQLNAGPNGSGDYSLLRQGAVGAGSTVTRSIYAKSNTGTNQIVTLVATNSSTQIIITPVWQRIVLANSSAGPTQFDLSVGGLGATPATADIIIWGAQSEVAAFATSYIPTVASQVTRAIDVCSIVAPLFAPWYNQAQGTFVASYQLAAPTLSQDLFMANAGAPLTASIGIYVGSGVAATGWARVGGATQCAIAASISSSANNKTAFGYATNDFSIAANGTLGTSDTSGTVPTVDRLTFGANNIAGNGQAFWLRSVQYYPVRLADFQLQALTT